MIDDTDEKDGTSDVSLSEEVESDAPSSTIDDTEGNKSSEVSSREQVQTSSIYGLRY